MHPVRYQFAFYVSGQTLAHPRPFLDQQPAPFAAVFRSIAAPPHHPPAPGRRNNRTPASVWNVGFEAVLVIEDQFRSLALVHQRIEGRQDMHRLIAKVVPLSNVSGRAQCCILPAPSRLTGMSSVPAHEPVNDSAHRRLGRSLEVGD